MSAGIEKPSFSSGLAVANGGLSCSLFWFGQPDSNDPRHPERNKIDSKKNDHARVRAPLTLDHKPSEVSQYVARWRYACMSRPWVPMKEAPKPENSSGYRPYRMDAQPGDWLTY